MKRMTCIGAQFVSETPLTTPQSGVEMLCRRESDGRRRHTFVATPSMNVSANSAMQLPLFEEPLANHRMHLARPAELAAAAGG
jgi:hypothetical protein